MTLPVFTGQDICRQAMMDAGVLGAGAPIDGTQAQDIVNKLNRILDNLNCEERFSYAEIQTSYTLIASHNPTLIGPTGDTGFVQAQRPISIDRASVIDTSITPNVYIHVDVVSYRWQAEQSVPGTTDIYALKLYYEQDWPNGKIYLWPVPTAAYKLNLWTRTILSQLLLTDTFSLPPGYWDAITLTLAEDICPMFEQEPSELLMRKALQARARVMDNNLSIPKIATRDAGMSGGPRKQTFNYATGLYNR